MSQWLSNASTDVWRDRDILMLIYAHRLSQENWSRLVERHAQRTAVKS